MALFKREKIADFCLCQSSILKVFKEKKNNFCVLGYLLFH